MLTPEDVVLQFITALNGGDWTLCSAMLSPAVERHSSTYGQPKINNSHDLLRFLKQELATFPDGKETVVFAFSGKNYVAVRSRFQGTQTGAMGSYPPSNRRLDAEFTTIYRVRDGLIAEIWVEWDALSGLIALGHMPEPTASA